MIKDYYFENPPIIIKFKEFEHDFIKYLDRVEIAEKIIKEIDPDLCYINSSMSHFFYEACYNLNIPNIYHHLEGEMGYMSEIKGKIIPFEKYFNSYNNNKTIYYSASPFTTKYMKKLGIKSDIKEIEIINFTTIKALSNKNVKIDKKEKKIIGMIGTTIYRKGYDIFLELAKIHKEYLFCWVGCDIENEIEYKDNLILVKKTRNPYKYLKIFDYFLMTSREDLGPLVIIESLFLNKPTFIIENTIGLEEEFVNLGCNIIKGEHSIDNISNFISKLDTFKIEIIDNSNKIKQHYGVENNITLIENDIITLTGSILSNKKENIIMIKIMAIFYII